MPSFLPDGQDYADYGEWLSQAQQQQAAPRRQSRRSSRRNTRDKLRGYADARMRAEPAGPPAPDFFTFQQRYGKLNMREISRVDLDKVVQDLDIPTIQKHIENIAFCDLRAGDLQDYTDQNFVKLFKLCQLTVEYLLNVQNKLASQSSQLQKDKHVLKHDYGSVQAEVQKQDAEIEVLKREMHQKQKSLRLYESLLGRLPGGRNMMASQLKSHKKQSKSSRRAERHAEKQRRREEKQARSEERRKERRRRREQAMEQATCSMGAAGPDTITIFVALPNGEALALVDVQPHLPVQKIYDACAERYPPSPEKMLQLTYKGVELDRASTVEEARVPSEATVFATLEPVGGAELVDPNVIAAEDIFDAISRMPEQEGEGEDGEGEDGEGMSAEDQQVMERIDEIQAQISDIVKKQNEQLAAMDEPAPAAPAVATAPAEEEGEGEREGEQAVPLSHSTVSAAGELENDNDYDQQIARELEEKDRQRELEQAEARRRADEHEAAEAKRRLEEQEEVSRKVLEQLAARERESKQAEHELQERLKQFEREMAKKDQEIAALNGRLNREKRQESKAQLLQSKVHEAPAPAPAPEPVQAQAAAPVESKEEEEDRDEKADPQRDATAATFLQSAARGYNARRAAAAKKEAQQKAAEEEAKKAAAAAAAAAEEEAKKDAEEQARKVAEEQAKKEAEAKAEAERAAEAEAEKQKQQEEAQLAQAAAEEKEQAEEDVDEYWQATEEDEEEKVDPQLQPFDDRPQVKSMVPHLPDEAEDRVAQLEDDLGVEAKRDPTELEVEKLKARGQRGEEQRQKVAELKEQLEHHARMERVFEQLDVNNDGSLSREELRSAYFGDDVATSQGKGKGKGKGKAMKMHSSLQEEFEKLVMETGEVPPPVWEEPAAPGQPPILKESEDEEQKLARMSLVFEKMDADGDGDGQISKAEFEHFFSWEKSKKVRASGKLDLAPKVEAAEEEKEEEEEDVEEEQKQEEAAENEPQAVTEPKADSQQATAAEAAVDVSGLPQGLKLRAQVAEGLKKDSDVTVHFSVVDKRGKGAKNMRRQTDRQRVGDDLRAVFQASEEQRSDAPFKCGSAQQRDDHVLRVEIKKKQKRLGFAKLVGKQEILLSDLERAAAKTKELSAFTGPGSRNKKASALVGQKLTFKYDWPPTPEQSLELGAAAAAAAASPSSAAEAGEDSSSSDEEDNNAGAPAEGEGKEAEEQKDEPARASAPTLEAGREEQQQQSPRRRRRAPRSDDASTAGAGADADTHTDADDLQAQIDACDGGVASTKAVLGQDGVYSKPEVLTEKLLTRRPPRFAFTHRVVCELTGEVPKPGETRGSGPLGTRQAQLQFLLKKGRLISEQLGHCDVNVGDPEKVLEEPSAANRFMALLAIAAQRAGTVGVGGGAASAGAGATDSDSTPAATPTKRSSGAGAGSAAQSSSRKGRRSASKRRTPGSSRRAAPSARADTKPEAKASTPYKDVGSKLRAAHDEVASLADKYEANASEPKANSRLHGASSVFDSLALADDITQAAAAGAAGGGPAADEEEALE